MTSGVYCITDAQTGRRYIGGARHIERRRQTHFCNLRHGKHVNKRMQQDFNLHPSAFSFCVLERCSLENVRCREQAFIEQFDSVKTGYNVNMTAWKTISPASSR